MSAALGRSIAINPNYVDALVFKAGQELEAGRLDEAVLSLDKAQKISPRSPDVHSVRAALLYLQDSDPTPEINATPEVSPRFGKLYETLARYATNTRRTEQAAQFARKAIELSPRLWSAHLSLGMSLLRMGQMTEGRTEVEKAFKGDPFNLWAKNTLDLLDTMADFRETKRGNFIIKTGAQETDVLSTYAGDLLDEASTKLIAKYRFTPKGPITIEIFPNHEDFAVRTLGIPGLGALGVCFGQVVSQDSPSARETGEFNWGSTLWHEYTHVITLQMTDYRIPRWFSEGLSVYEERRARPGWGDDWNPLFVRAFLAGRWFKMEDLDSGFQRPRSPEDVPIAYFRLHRFVNSLNVSDSTPYCECWRSIVTVKTPEILQQVLKLNEADFDRAFSPLVDAKTDRLLHR